MSETENSFKLLRKLHQCEGIEGFLSSSILCEYEAQVFSQAVCQLTFLCYLGQTSHNLTSMQGKDVLKAKDSEGQGCVHSDVIDNDRVCTEPLGSGHEAGVSEEWDVDTSPLVDEDYQKALADMVEKNSLLFARSAKKRQIAAAACEVAATAECPTTEDCSVWKSAEPTPKNYTLQKSDPKKIHVKNINFRTSQRKLWTFFSQYGEVDYCHLLKGHRGKSTGRGYVILKDEATAARILKLDKAELELDRRTLQVEPYMHKKYVDKPSGTVEQTQNTDMSASGDAIGLHDTHHHGNEQRGHSTDPDHVDFTSLNDDVMLQLFSFLSMKERIMCERVCKKWRQICIKLWQSLEHFTLKDFYIRFGGVNDRQLSRLLKRGCPMVKSVDLSAAPRFLSDAALEAIANYCPSVLHLNLSGMFITNKGLSKLAERIPKLESLQAQNCHDIGEKGIWWLFHLCKELKYLNFNNNKRIIGQCFHVLCWHLDHLSLDSCSKLQDLALEKIVLRSTQLSVLKLDCCISLTDQGLRYLTQCKTLKVLHLSSLNHAVTSAGFKAVAELPLLEVLHVNNNSGVSDEALRLIGDGCTHLRELDITSCHRQVTDLGVSGLAGCTQLQILKMSYLHQVDQGLTNIARDCHLVELVARGCGGLTNEGMRCVADLACDMERLDISGCDQLDDSLLDCLVQGVGADPTRNLSIFLGGTSMCSDGYLIPDNMTVSQDDFCAYHQRPDQDLVPIYSGSDDSDDYFEDFQEAEADGFLDHDDPLFEENFELS